MFLLAIMAVSCTTDSVAETDDLYIESPEGDDEDNPKERENGNQ